ncbi:hypothetical protein Pmani_022082 [Petrolisthes manimaculis]|uniref:Uncharacterized protein n=1 Tax=Petrolisthes manimaculis TaxID=1843537 RepID=A0AAE1PDM5_9EUCA|nr:hypothetical protein Pmani_022082 [Petrolisthes manimaculis]
MATGWTLHSRLKLKPVYSRTSFEYTVLCFSSELIKPVLQQTKEPLLVSTTVCSSIIPSVASVQASLIPVSVYEAIWPEVMEVQLEEEEEEKEEKEKRKYKRRRRRKRRENRRGGGGEREEKIEEEEEEKEKRK